MFMVDAWQADGPKGESGLAELRCGSRAEFAGFVERWSKDQRCVLITKARTDKRSLNYEILYIKPGYASETTPQGSKAEKPTTGRKPGKINLCPCCGQRVFK